MLKNTQLLRYLSDTEQESLVGGQIFPMLDLFSEGKLFLQKTDFETHPKIEEQHL